MSQSATLVLNEAQREILAGLEATAQHNARILASVDGDILAYGVKKYSAPEPTGAGDAPVSIESGPFAGTLSEALSSLSDTFTELHSFLPTIRDGLGSLAEIDDTAAVYGELFVDRLLALTGSTERLRGPATTPTPAQGPTPAELAERRQRVIQRTQQRLISARQTERATGDIADKLQACLEYAVRNTEPVDAYDLSNEERKTEDELKTLEREIDRYRDTEARAAERAETAERVLVEMAAWPRSVG